MKTKHFWLPFMLGFVLAALTAYSIAKPFINSETNVFQPEYRTLDDKKFTLNKKSGKVRLISYWATWCKPCVAEFKDFQKLKEKYPEKLEIITVSDEEPSKISEFKNRHSYSFNFLYTNKKLSSIGINAVPVNVILDKDGNSIYSKLGTISPELIEELLSE